jgi:hypothetical protein
MKAYAFGLRSFCFLSDFLFWYFASKTKYPACYEPNMTLWPEYRICLEGIMCFAFSADYTAGPFFAGRLTWFRFRGHIERSSRRLVLFSGHRLWFSVNGYLSPCTSMSCHHPSVRGLEAKVTFTSSGLPEEWRFLIVKKRLRFNTQPNR